jgi:hypothetical protein
MRKLAEASRLLHGLGPEAKGPPSWSSDSRRVFFFLSKANPLYRANRERLFLNISFHIFMFRHDVLAQCIACILSILQGSLFRTGLTLAVTQLVPAAPL